MRDADCARTQLIPFTPGVEKGEIAGVAHDSCLPTRRSVAAFMKGKLYRELNAYAGRKERAYCDLEWLGRCYSANQQLGTRRSRDDIRCHTAINQPQIDGGLSQQRIGGERHLSNSLDGVEQ